MEPYLYSEISPMFGFLGGVVAGLGLVGLWRRIQLRTDLRAARVAADTLLGQPFDNPQDRAAYERVKSCKSRLRWQKKPNPEWIAPLIEEIPKLIQEIAEIYYPDAVDPIWAPGLSHFARAIHITAMDIADFLQNRHVGRLLDVSATTVWRTREILRDDRVKNLHKWYRRVLPVWQIIKVKSPLMWASLAASNMAVRTLQPAVINIVARHAIELYSGRLTSSAGHVTS